jgi:integrase
LGWTYSRAVPLFDAKGEIVEWFGAASDVSSRKEAEENYRKLAETLDAEVRARTRDLEERNAEILRQSERDAGARHIELNLDATKAAARLVFRAHKLGATEPEHYLMPKHLSRIMFGPDKGKRGYDPNQHQRYWDTAWHSLTSAVRCPRCGKVQAPAKNCRVETCNANMHGLTSATEGLRFHDLRHSFITHMVERGVPLGTIGSFVGQMSARMIRHYTHITTGAGRKAAETLDQEPMLSIGALYPQTTALERPN